jgi:hypothetical protein
MGPEPGDERQENPYKASVGCDVMKRDVVLRDVMRRGPPEGWGMRDEG